VIPKFEPPSCFGTILPYVIASGLLPALQFDINPW
jgi:hypothetical protein